MQSFRIIVSLSCISLILFGFQNCSPMSTKVGELPSASSDTALGEINAPPSRDVSAPSVMIDSPTANTMISGTVTISAVAVDDSGVRGVQFFIDGAAFGAEDTSPPFSISWDTTTVTSRSYTLGARARDAAGNIAQSAEVVITVDNRPPSDTTAPVVSITSPAANANVNGTINLTATATDNVAIAGVQFFIDGSPVGAEDTSSPYSVSFNTTTVQNGNRSLTARARDNFSE
jgi:hypothetical protein